MTKQKLVLKNKLAFVIGGSGFLGVEIVASLINNGAKVVVLELKKNKDFRRKIFFEKFDLSKSAQIEKELEKIIKRYSCPDIFINAAYPRTSDWKNSTYKKLKIRELDKNISIHLNSFIWSTMKIAEQMKKKKKKGSIIILNSIYGVVGQNKNLYKKTSLSFNPVYSAIKGGLLSFIKNLASFYGIYNIRSNSIVCGGIEGHIAGQSKKQSRNFIKKYSTNTLLNRMGKPKDVASAVVFLSSDDSAYITGSELVVDGGYTAI